MKTKALALSLALALGGVALCRSLAAADARPTSTVVRIELPTETATYRPGAGVQQAQTFCITCHSADYIAIQPPMPRKFWEATVKKMKEKYGAPVPEDLTPLVDYFTANYGAK
jgi:sulfite dehydrogenase (cytochrome) subunit B